MPLITVDFYTRNQIQATPDRLYIFGDNFAERGFGGQAKEARGEPNSIGIPTKRYPTFADNAYLKDEDLSEWKYIAEPRLFQILNVLKAGGIVVWPASGIGTGLAQLNECAPLIFAELRKWFDEFQKYAEDADPKRGRLSLEPVPVPIPIRIA